MFGLLTPVRAAAAATLLIAALHPAGAAHAGGVYFVKQGDTLSSISRVFGTTPARLMEENRLENSRLAIGDRLRIPDATDAPAPAAAAAPPAAGAAPPRQHVDERMRQALCREETVYHKVAKGDTLAAVGRRYDVAVDDLLRLNGLKLRSRLSIGQRLVVRRTGPRTHVARRGETFSKVAARHAIPVERLVELNGGVPRTLVAGERLLLEECDRLAAAGSAPPPLAVDDSGEFIAAVAQASLQARREQQELLGADGGAAPPPAANRVIELAKTMLNIPYRFGGTTLRGIDCSAYVQRVFGLADLSLPRTAREQFGVGALVAREALAVGDLVFFRTYASFPSHVGIYLGDNLFIHASSVGRRVTIDSLDAGYYRKRFLGGRRLLPDSVGAVASAP